MKLFAKSILGLGMLGFTLLLFVSSEGNAMDVLGHVLGKKIVLFSKVNGVITLNKKPLVGARVLRQVKWKDKTYKDETLTAADGSFHLPEMPGPGRILMAEFVAYQRIAVEYQGNKWQIWETVKGDPLANRELVDMSNWESAGMPIQFTCELSEPERSIKLLMAVLGTNCHFPVKIGKVLESVPS